jgi:hypothetical protein
MRHPIGPPAEALGVSEEMLDPLRNSQVVKSA